MLSSLQRNLEDIYEIDVPHDVDDFLITDPALARALEGDGEARETEEKLLVAQDGEFVDLALYVDDAVIERLRRDDPMACLHDGNIADFCTALEGVSHFVYLTWNASRERGVSLLELEMQAEVDKYVTMAFLIGEQASTGGCSTTPSSIPSSTGRVSSATATRTTTRRATARCSSGVT